MKTPIKFHLPAFLSGTAIGISLLVAQAVVSDPEPTISATFEPCQSALPRDQGEVVLNRLEPDGQGGLVLKSEYHAVLGFGMASVPVSVE